MIGLAQAIVNWPSSLPQPQPRHCGVLAGLSTPRLPGADDYLQALGEPIRHHLEGEATTEEALAAAAEAWETISIERGREEQHRAYLRSVKLCRLRAGRLNR